MNRIMKKTAAAVLSVAMLASSAAALNQSGVQNGLTITASAAGASTGTYAGLTYRESSNFITITGCNNNITTLSIPEKINNKPVTNIDRGAFANKTALKTVKFYANVPYVPAYAFANCTNLTTVYLSNAVTSIEAAAFVGCTKLEKLDIPFNTTYMGYGALAGCTSLKKVIFHGNTQITAYVFKNVDTGAETAFTGTFYVHDNTYPSAYAFNKHYNRVIYTLGDVNNDNKVNATDASQILGFYASLSTGGNIPAAQREKMEICADVDRDNHIDACDASAVLGYYAALSTGYTYSFEYYMANR